MSWYEEAEKDIKGSVEDIEEGRLAVMIFAAGEANRLRKSLLSAGIISSDEPMKNYRMWNIDLWEIGRRVLSKTEELREKKRELEEKLRKMNEKDKGYKEVKEEIGKSMRC